MPGGSGPLILGFSCGKFVPYSEITGMVGISQLARFQDCWMNSVSNVEGILAILAVAF